MAPTPLIESISMLKTALIATLRRFWPLLLATNIAFALVEFVNTRGIDVTLIVLRLGVTILAVGLIGVPLMWHRLNTRRK